MATTRKIRGRKGKSKDEDLIRVPEQARSRETMDRILTAMEELLEEKPFERITMQEIAQRSDTGVSSIYARFRDKQVLVLGVHARLRDQTLECLVPLSDPDRWANKSTEQIVTAVVSHCVKYYRSHAALLRAALRIELPEMRERQAGVLQFASERFSAIFVPRYPDHAKDITFAIEGSVKMLASMMYTSFIFSDLDVGQIRFANDRANIRLLTRAITSLIESSHDR